MSDATGQFGCDGCGKQYRWKVELAGKKVKCKCGQVMVVPDELVDDDAMAMFELADGSEAAPVAAAPEPSMPTPDSASITPVDVPGDDGGEYELSEDPAAPPPPPPQPSGPCPECGSLLSDGVVLCVGCGFNRATGQKLGAASVAKEISSKGDGGGKFGGFLANMKGGAGTSKEHISMGDAGDDKLWKAKQVLIPSVLLAFGLCLKLLLIDSAGYDVPIFALLFGELIVTALGVALLVGGCFLAAMLLSTTFGDLLTAIVKLAAIFVFSNALVFGVNLALPFGGIIINLAILAVCYYGLLAFLFDLDMQEVGIVVGIFIAIWYLSQFILAAMIFGMLG